MSLDRGHNKYHKMTAVVYQIYCKNSEIKETYIGSTKNLKRRMYQHKSNIDNNSIFYKFVQENGGFKNWDVRILKEFKYFNKQLNLIQEQRFINALRPILNTTKNIVKYETEYGKKIRNEEEKNYKMAMNAKIILRDTMRLITLQYGPDHNNENGKTWKERHLYDIYTVLDLEIIGGNKGDAEVIEKHLCKKIMSKDEYLCEHNDLYLKDFETFMMCM